MHRSAAVGFTSAVEVYEASRPTIPAEAVDWLVGALGVGAGDAVLELGAGTGKFTRLLVERGVDVLAVEPVAAMRERLAALGGGVTALDAVAESLPLAPGAARAAVAVQAFHWVDAPRALEELHRVLEPGGRIGLAWNDRDADAAPWQHELDALLEPRRGDTPTHRDGAWRAAVEASPAYELRESRAWRWAQPMTAALLVDRVASISFVAALPDDERAALLAEVRALAGRVAGSDDDATPIELPYVAELHVIVPEVVGVQGDGRPGASARVATGPAVSRACDTNATSTSGQGRRPRLRASVGSLPGRSARLPCPGEVPRPCVGANISSAADCNLTRAIAPA